MRYSKSKIIAIAAVAALTACTDKYDCNLSLEKPENMTNSEYLNSFGVLKSYEQKEGNSPFLLSASIASADFQKQDIAYSTLFSNFDAADITGSASPLLSLNDAGEYDFGAVSGTAAIAAENGIKMFGGDLVSCQGQRATYYNSLITPVVIPVKPERGTDKIIDFDDLPIGTTFPMYTDDGEVAGAFAEVVADPKNPNNKCLHYKSPSWAFQRPNLKLSLPHSLGSYTALTFDILTSKGQGLDGFATVVNIYGSKIDLGALNALGVKDGEWSTVADVAIASTVAKLPESGSNTISVNFGPIAPTCDCYIDNVRMAYETSGKGTTTIDFESNKKGDTYPMQGLNPWGGNKTAANGSNFVDNDGSHTNYLTVKMNQTHPKFHVVLKNGMTLADYTHLTMDMRLRNGMYGAGMRVIINDKVFSLKSAANYGFSQDNKWKDEGILVKFIRTTDAADDGSIQIPDDMLSLTEFDLCIGSASGSWEGDIDNIRLYWEAKPTIIEKTPEEKKAIFTAEMKKWVGGMVAAGAEADAAWNIISEPLSTVSDENTFHWGEYLGDVAYAQTAVQLARDTAAVLVKDLTLFVKNTMKQSDDLPAMATQLTELVDSWEKDGKTKIDGFNIPLSIVCSADAETKQAACDALVNMLETLASTRKLVRISNLALTYTDADGVVVTNSNLTDEQRKEAAGFLSFFIKQYQTIVPAHQQYGISLSGLAEGNGTANLCPWTSSWNRNLIYVGVVDGLSGSAE